MAVAARCSDLDDAGAGRELVVLARDIVTNGMSPIDRFLVTPAEDNPDAFVVLEAIAAFPRLSCSPTQRWEMAYCATPPRVARASRRGRLTKTAIVEQRGVSRRETFDWLRTGQLDRRPYGRRAATPCCRVAHSCTRISRAVTSDPRRTTRATKHVRLEYWLPGCRGPSGDR